MANLISIHYVDTTYLIDKTQTIPGDIYVIIKDTDESCTIYSQSMIKMYICNLQRQLLEVQLCQYCYQFHLSDTFIKTIMGNHWKKYKQRWCVLGLPISNDSRCSV